MMSQRRAKEPDGDWKAEAGDGGGDGGGRRVAAAPVPLLPPPLPLPGSPLGARRIGHGRQLKMAAMAADDGGGGEARRAAAGGGRRDGGGCGRDGAACGALRVAALGSGADRLRSARCGFARPGAASLGQIGLL